ncbi:MAG TPA: glycosyltransferase family 1 protein [Candidatus Eisenbacteria bacterium]|nr:glycosyltransferase family 1 protein [Candidatus Eisenbacteria bacterium]
MKTIGFDARMIDHPGIGRYIRELLHEMVAVQGLPVRRLQLSAPVYGWREQIELPLRARGVEALHVPHFNIPVFYRGRLVVTVHDLTYLHDAKASRSSLGPAYAKFLFGQIAARADAVLAVSGATRDDLLNSFPRMDPQKVVVTHEAASPVFRPAEDREAAGRLVRSAGVEGPYVLAVGSLKPHKNYERLLAAMEEARRRGLPHELVVIGRPDPRRPEIEAALRVRPFVRYLGERSDAELAAFYNHADLFVFPSLREGFGLPLLEAMACGTPAAASNVSSLPEVGGEAACYFDPLKIDAIAEVLYNVLENRELRQKMSAAGLVRARSFSWEKTADRTRRVYEQVLR